LANMIRTRSSGRGRLPVWVVRKRSLLSFIPRPLLAFASESGHRAASGQRGCIRIPRLDDDRRDPI
jgi:hypothetical protein